MFTKWPFWALAAIALAAALGYRMSVDPQGSASGETIKAAFVTGGVGDFWDSAIAGAKQAARELNVELDIRKPEGESTLEEQMHLLSVVSSLPLDAVALCPLDPERQTQLINQIAVSKPVITYSSDASASARHGYVGTSNYSAGLVAGTLVKKSFPNGGGKIAVLSGHATQESSQERIAGFKHRIAESPNPAESPTDTRFQIVGVMADDGSAARCEENLRQALEEHPDLACVVCMAPHQAAVVLGVLEQESLLEKIRLVLFDTSDATLEAVMKGDAYAAVAQDPYKYGYEAVTMMDSLCRGDKDYMPVVGRGAIHVSVEPVLKTDVADFRERVAARLEQADGT
ncbi:D-ribose-binding periplasmic protein precursor [Pseudobythopirellula maris]|uniref:D-ribose-binding periplasmic protein n=1 Tax=Pseudobythopirellula maris TaxID=2527991 RepID=A0A5C5ZM39_9BACT|nr:substrate-binding domain-containing protein [Pseudobythopirellula maris]TWT88512.1 D-ribose-binding periplasmic protein precursor [Pseudobythopirellula maris]